MILGICPYCNNEVGDDNFKVLHYAYGFEYYHKECYTKEIEEEYQKLSNEINNDIDTSHSDVF